MKNIEIEENPLLTDRVQLSISGVNPPIVYNKLS